MLKDNFLKIDSVVGSNGIVNVIENLINQLPEKVDREVLYAFLDTTTACLSERDLKALGQQVLEHVTIEEDLSEEDVCPHGGDNTDCKSCVYYPDFHWSKHDRDCVRYQLDEEDVSASVRRSDMLDAQYIALANIDGELSIDFIKSSEDLKKFMKTAHDSTLYLEVLKED